MNAELILMSMVPATYLVMLAVEARFPARRFPAVAWWRVLGALALVLLMGIGVVTPLLLPLDWLARHRLIDATGLGVVPGALVGYLVVAFLGFVWHRALHRVPLLWRTFPQMHHAPRRLDLSSAAIFHPLDLVMFNVVQVGGLTLLLGLDPLAAGIVGYVATFGSLFQHWNVRTPRFVGWFLQRPEAHCVHHQLGVHAGNYSDVPVFDMLIGTYANPAAFDGAVGFDRPAPVLDMLRFVDVHAGDHSTTTVAVIAQPETE